MPIFECKNPPSSDPNSAHCPSAEWLIWHTGQGIIINRQRLASDLRLCFQQSHLPSISEPVSLIEIPRAFTGLHEETWWEYGDIMGI